jgi:hypothetical protein
MENLKEKCVSMLEDSDELRGVFTYLFGEKPYKVCPYPTARAF